MTLIFWKPFFYRTSILFWLSVSLAGLMLGSLLIISATAAPPPPQGRPSLPNIKAATQTITQEQNSELAHNPRIDAPSAQSSSSQKRNRALLKANFEKMKHDTQELSDLAKALQLELAKSNENVLSLGIVDKADKIEKLAKQIKGNARGF